MRKSQDRHAQIVKLGTIRHQKTMHKNPYTMRKSQNWGLVWVAFGQLLASNFAHFAHGIWNMGGGCLARVRVAFRSHFCAFCAWYMEPGGIVWLAFAQLLGSNFAHFAHGIWNMGGLVWFGLG